MKKVAFIAIALAVAFGLTTAATVLMGRFIGEPRDWAEAARLAGHVTLVAFPSGMLVALLLSRRRQE